MNRGEKNSAASKEAKEMTGRKRIQQYALYKISHSGDMLYTVMLYNGIYRPLVA